MIQVSWNCNIFKKGSDGRVFYMWDGLEVEPEVFWSNFGKVREERDRYKAALEKMLIPGSGLMCNCGVCYICIAAEALRTSEIRCSHVWEAKAVMHGVAQVCQKCGVQSGA